MELSTKLEAVPLWLNIQLNTLYFLAQHLAFSLMTGYCFYLLLSTARI